MRNLQYSGAKSAIKLIKFALVEKFSGKFPVLEE